MKKAWLAMRPKVLQRIRPSASYTRRARAAVEALSKRALELAPTGVALRPVLVGSLAKDTHTLPAPDIDLFLLFPTATSRGDLETEGLRIGKKLLQRPALKYAEHPYVHGTFRGFRFDVVPAFHVATPTGKLSAVDRSPFHTAYVKARLKPSQRDDVRCLKQFLKGIGCYGAETATSGVSGYLAELLILKFGTFWDTLLALRERHPPIALALEGAPGALGGDLVFVDPVDPRRNAAAAVGRERLETLLRAARAFTAIPKIEFFWPRAPKAESRDELTRHLSHRGIVGLQVPAPTVRPEARVPHLRRFADKLGRHFEAEGFRIVRHLVDQVPGGYLLLWEHEPIVLPDAYEHLGPRTDDAANTRKFLQKWQTHPDAVKLPHPREGRWVVTLRRNERDPVAVLAPALARLAEGTEFPKGWRGKARLGFGMEFAVRPGTRLALSRMLVPRDPWEP